MHKTQKSFKTYIFRTLKSIDPNLHITSQTLNTLDSICRTMAFELVNKSVILLNGNSKKTISSSELETVSKMFLPDSLSLDFIAFANNCIRNFHLTLNTELESKLESKTNEEEKLKKKQITRENKAGLIFSVSLCEKYIRQILNNALNVKKCAPVFLASLLEMFVKHSLKLASKVTYDSNKVTVNLRFLFLSIKNDVELTKFMSSLNIILLEGGVLPQNIEIKKGRKKINSSRSLAETTVTTEETSNSNSKRRRHRWRPGTKTVMEIRKLQKSSDNLIQHAPFIRIVKEIVSDIFEMQDYRFTKDFLKGFQNYIEHKTIETMSISNKIAIHNNRETVYAKDVDFSQTLIDQSIQDIKLNNNIPLASIKQLALRAGIRRIGDDSIDRFRKYIYTISKECISRVLLCSKYHKSQTLNLSMLVEILNINHIHIAVLPQRRKNAVRKTIEETERDKPSLEEYSTLITEIEPEVTFD